MLGGGGGGSALPARPAGPVDPLIVDIPAASCTRGLLNQLRSMFRAYPGDLPVLVNLVHDYESTRLRLGPDCCVDGSPALLFELGRLLGPGAVQVVVASGPAPPTVPAGGGPGSNGARRPVAGPASPVARRR